MIFHREPLCITRDQENTTDGVVHKTPLTDNSLQSSDKDQQELRAVSEKPQTQTTLNGKLRILAYTNFFGSVVQHYDDLLTTHSLHDVRGGVGWGWNDSMDGG